jgi:predicted DNA-binding protein (MmcQ/YjbR family)
MTLDDLREYCLSKKGVEETQPFGPDTIVYKVNGKIFLITGFDNDPFQFNVKCEPELAIELREQYDCVLPGYHMNKKHWNTIIVDGQVKSALLFQWIDHSYDLISSNTSTSKNKRKK